MADCKLNFTPQENQIAHTLFDALIKQGVTCQQMDQGYHVLNFSGKQCSKKNDRTCVKGANDGVLEAPEVIEYALKHHDQYRQLIEKATGEASPFVLDDLNSSTKFDKNIRGKIQANITGIRRILLKKGIQERTENYKEAMALGLFYLTALPHTRMMDLVAAEQPKIIQRMHQELKAVGLEEYYHRLRSYGGLGLELDYSEQYTALEAFKNGKGDCSEFSMILFAIFRMAGFKPTFFYVSADSVKSSVPSVQAYLSSLPSRMNHICLGLLINGKSRLYDPILSDSNPYHSPVYPLKLSQVLSMHVANRGFVEHNKGKKDRAIAEWTKSHLLDPSNPVTNYNLGHVWSMKGKLDKAITYLNKSLEVRPRHFGAHMMRGYTWVHKKEYDKAIADFSQATQIKPTSRAAYSQLLTILIIIKGDFGAATKVLAHLLQKRLLGVKMLKEIVLTLSGERWKRTSHFKNIAKNFETDTDDNEIHKAEATFIIAYSLWLAGIKKVAVDEFKDGLELIEVSDFKKKPAKSTKEFFREMFKLMPKEMGKNGEVAAAVKIIKSKAKIR